MADLAAFTEAGFEPKAWINAACKGRPQEEPLEKFLAELEMRLQLGAEEVEAALADSSAAALRRIPVAQHEAARLRADAAALRATTGALLSTAGRDAAAAAAAAAPLAALHRAKTSMSSACETLQEATQLSSAFQKIEDVFATGDLPRAAQMLASMGRSLSLVGDVPEFKEGRARLRALEERLERRVEGRLLDALAGEGPPGPDAAGLARVLLAAGRGAMLERLYCESRAARAAALWEAAGGGDGGAAGGCGAGWLLSFYNQLLELLQSEAAWLASALPEARHSLLPMLVAAAFGKVAAPLRARLESVDDVAALQALQQDVLVMCRGLIELFAATAAAATTTAAAPPGAASAAPGGPAASPIQAPLQATAPTAAAAASKGVSAAAAAAKDAPAVGPALQLVLQPLETALGRYRQLEDAALAADIGAAIAVDPATDDLDGVAGRLAAGLGGAFAALCGAVGRCVALSGGTELQALLAVVDGAAQQYLTRLQAAASILQDRFVKASSGGAAGGASVGVDVMLSLLLLGREAARKLADLEALVRSTITTVVPRLESLAQAGPPPGAPLELLPLRLSAFPEKLQPLSRLRSQLDGVRFIALPAAAAACRSLCDGIDAAVYDTLLAPVAEALSPLPEQPEWRGGGGGGGGAAGAHVPAFSAYPLASVTAVGEYLMALPQQLEALMVDDAGGGEGGGEGEGGDELAAEWLDKVVSGAGQLYVDTVLRVPALSHGGAAQLAADAEYVANVMGALAVAAPPGLVVLQVFSGLQADAWADAAAGALADGGADARVLRSLALMRGIAWSPSQALPSGGDGGGGGGGGDAAGSAAPARDVSSPER